MKINEILKGLTKDDVKEIEALLQEHIDDFLTLKNKTNIKEEYDFIALHLFADLPVKDSKVVVSFSMPIKDFYLQVCIHGIKTHWVDINDWNAFIKAFEKFIRDYQTPKGA